MLKIGSQNIGKIYLGDNEICKAYLGSDLVYECKEDFIFTVKTDNLGTSGNDQFTIPTSTTGITMPFNYDIETSDGYVATGITGSHTITFPSGAGTHSVSISGVFPYMKFPEESDALKILKISNWGVYGLGSTSQNNAFTDCTNLTITANDTGYFGDVVDFTSTWRNCESLTSFPLIDTSSGETFSSTWFGCTNLEAFPLIDTSSGIDFTAAWAGCESFEGFPVIDLTNADTISSAWSGCIGLASFPLLDTSNVEDFNTAWQKCTDLTSFPLIDTSSSVSSFANSWRNCTDLETFPANLFDDSLVSNYSNAFNSTNLSAQSIDDILVSIDTSGVTNGTFFQSGGLAPSTTVGEPAIDSLVAKGWTITVTGGYTP